MAESTLSLSRTDLLQIVGDYLGYGRNHHIWRREPTAQVTRCVQSGERQFYQPFPLPGESSVHVWSFLNQRLATTISEPYSTGTITVVAGEVTLADGTWPTWAADGWLVIDGVGYYVATRDSGTVLTLDDATVTAAAGTEYEIQRWQYTLPDDFGAFIEPTLAFAPSDEQQFPVRLTGPGEIYALRQNDDWTTYSQPVMAAVNSLSSDQTTGQRNELLVFPTPTSPGTLIGTYTILPLAITDSAPYPLGGQPHAETLRESCLAVAEVEKTGKFGAHRELFMQRLAASIAYDRKTTTKQYFGKNLDHSRGDGPRQHRARGVTYLGSS